MHTYAFKQSCVNDLCNEPDRAIYEIADPFVWLCLVVAPVLSLCAVGVVRDALHWHSALRQINERPIRWPDSRPTPRT